ncbi:interleukin-1 receptor type 1 isoform X2 [Mixophyes fleayi]|uniref:interleukin-1 receptor type 1 isoform X2 n=1 Tax=Mixophyes fleayi TaxID=3061075 RepID=UPI003F4E3725
MDMRCKAMIWEQITHYQSFAHQKLEEKYFQQRSRTCRQCAGKELGPTEARGGTCGAVYSSTGMDCDLPALSKVHKMFKPWLIFILHILTVTYLPSYKAELCNDDGVEFELAYVTDGQPVNVICPLQYLLEKNNFNVTWFRKDSQTEITSDRQARVHQYKNFLSFYPARLDDKDYYSCVLRNSTYCTQRLKKVEVFKNDDGLCYNHTVMYRFKPPMQSALTIECPDMSDYVNEEKTQIKWFKECQPLDLDGDKYYAKGFFLNLNKVTPQDTGNYTCEATFTYNGTSFKKSQAIDYFIIIDKQSQSAPVMIKPTNNLLQVELGAAITLTCEVIYNANTDLYWTFNDSFIEEYSDDGRVTMGETYTFTQDGTQLVGSTLNFSKVKEEDYNRKFYCHVIATSSKAFVILEHPEANFQGFLIAIFVAILFVIVIAIIAIRVFKVEIVLWYRSSCFAKRDHKDGKIYDAYIMYPKKAMGSSSYDMDMFVLKVLPEVLEKQCAYQLFIIGRDDLPGQAIADVVDDAISQSRRLIIVLGHVSNEISLGDDFEQKIAMYDALIRNKIKVILIELEKITDHTYMPESIKYIKQKQGVVRWKGEFTEATLQPNTRFWKNIRYRMPPAQHPSNKELYYISSED